jgi:hypothetical protein
VKDVLVRTELACPPAVRKLPGRVGPFSLVIAVEGDFLVPGLKLISGARRVAQGRKKSRQRGEIITQGAGPGDPRLLPPARILGSPGNAVVRVRLRARRDIAVSGEARESSLEFGAQTAYPRCRPQSSQARAIAST